MLVQFLYIYPESGKYGLQKEESRVFIGKWTTRQ